MPDNNIDLLYPDGAKQNAKHLSGKAIECLELTYIARLICPYNTDYALNVLSELITDESTISFRQDILQDFINVPQLEHQLYKSLHTIYMNSVSVYAKSGSTQSFFELNANIENIEAFTECMEECHRFCIEHGSRLKSDGIKRVLGEIERRYTSDEYKEMLIEIAELKSVMAEGFKSVTFAMNLDNLMRPSEVMLLSVDKDPIRKQTLFSRLLTKDNNAEPLTEIYYRKHKDGQINAVDETLFKELDALGGGYMQRFNTAIKLCYAASTEFLVKLAPQIDFYIGAKNLIERTQSLGLEMCRPTIFPTEERIFRCSDMYDPVFANKLVAAASRDDITISVRANDCHMDDEARLLLITGTNNGGKTTFLRATAINQILAQSGLYVGASAAEISPCSGIFVHFPEEKEVGINTSRFTEECRELRSTIEACTEHSLVLMNESLSGTNPYDSLVLGEELMRIFADIGCRLIYTTHILDLTQCIDNINAEAPKSRLGSLIAECDQQGRPTYRITAGKPDFSRNARYIFDKYGISFDEYRRIKS